MAVTTATPTMATLTINPTIDTSTTVERVIVERKLRCGAPRHEPGGGGLNVSRAIRKLGGESVAVYPAGGLTGQLLKELLDQEGIRHRSVPIEGWTRQNLMVLDETTRQLYRFLMPGPELKPAEWQRCLDELSALRPAPAYLVASGSLAPGMPEDFYVQAARLAKKLGSRLIVDTSGKALRAAAQAGVYLLKPNLRELSELAGLPIEDETQQEELARQIIRSGRAEVVVVSLGAGGAFLVSAEASERLRSPAVPIRSKVGAGDSMVAGIVLSLARGWSVRDAVRFGVAAGAAAVMTLGTELCRREDTERLFEHMRVEGS